jgi:hypothetical protein
MQEIREEFLYMPARKPSSLITRAETKDKHNARTAGEAGLMPKTTITKAPPAGLKGHKFAGDVWRRLIGLYFETEGTIVTAFDADLLIKYCLAEEELQELFKLRGEIKKLWTRHSSILANMNPKNDALKDYFNALAQANALLQRFQGMDARLDGKRKMVFALAQSMYLTPRSRAGVAPPEKPPEKPKSKMGGLLDED